MENCPNCGLPMEESHECVPSEEASETDATVVADSEEESETPEMEM